MRSTTSSLSWTIACRSISPCLCSHASHCAPLESMRVLLSDGWCWRVTSLRPLSARSAAVSRRCLGRSLAHRSRLCSPGFNSAVLESDGFCFQTGGAMRVATWCVAVTFDRRDVVDRRGEARFSLPCLSSCLPFSKRARRAACAAWAPSWRRTQSSAVHAMQNPLCGHTRLPRGVPWGV